MACRVFWCLRFPPAYRQCNHMVDAARSPHQPMQTRCTSESTWTRNDCSMQLNTGRDSHIV
eukprot:1114385-Pyramimonas_sp.AAC.1